MNNAATDINPDPRRWIDQMAKRASTISEHAIDMVQLFGRYLEARSEPSRRSELNSLLHPDAFFQMWSLRRVLPQPEVKGRENVATWHEELSSRCGGRFPAEELEIDKLYEGKDGIAMDGVFRGRYPSEVLTGLDQALPSGFVIISVRLAMLPRFRDSLFEGYDTYVDNFYDISAC